MLRFFKGLTVSLAVVLAALSLLWACGAIWFRAPFPEFARILLCGPIVLFGIGSLIALFRGLFGRAFLVLVILLAPVHLWWATLTPPTMRDWSPDVARQVTGVIEGDILTLTDVREFKWHSPDDATPVWTTRQFDLTTMRSTDLFLSYWAGPEMAHVVLSFGFENGEYIAWSVEVRRVTGGAFSPIADLFKANTLAIVAAVETDVIGVRSNLRGEDVQLFRLRWMPDTARALLEEYVRQANALADQPKWYNSLTTNCTTVIFQMMSAIGDGQMFDWRMIVNGYLPNYAYDRKTLNTEFSLSELRERGKISERAKAAGLERTFSSQIRIGVPDAPINEF